MTTSCLNCGEPPAGRYCQGCGQRADLQPFTVGMLLRQVPRVLLDLDRGVWPTLKSLVLRPGEVINSYLDGRRARYSSPFVLVLLFAGINSVAYASGVIDFSKITAPLGGSNPGNFLAQRAFEYYSLLLLLQIPLVSAITRLCFRNSRRNYAEHMVMNTYLAACTSAEMTCLFPVYLLLDDTQYFTLAWSSNVLVFSAYYVFAFCSVFAGSGRQFATVARAVAAITLQIVIQSLLFGAAAILYVLYARTTNG